MEVPSKKGPCDRHAAIAAINQFIRTMATTAEGRAAVLDEWKEKPWDVASKILDKWEAVRVEAAKHASLLRCCTDTRPTGRSLIPLLALRLEDGILVERILHEIVGIPVDIVRHMRALYAKKVQVQAAGAKARRQTVSKTECGVRAAAAAITSLLCVARCASCAPGCGQPRSRCPMCVSCRWPASRGCAAVCPRHSPPCTRRLDVAVCTRQLCSKPLHAIRRSAQCAPRRPSGGIGASPGRSLLPAYACVACNFMHVRRMCLRWAQSRVGAWADLLRIYPSADAVVRTR